MAANSVVLPAPFGPISAVILPASALNDASVSAASPPKRFDRPSTRRSASAMGVLRRRNLAGGQPLHRLAQVRQQSRNAAPGKCNHEDQHTAIDHEVEAGRIAGDEL